MASLMPNGKQQFFNAAGQPLAGGKLYTYIAGTTTPQNTFSDSAGVTPNTNPVILDARGEALIFWSGSYKVALQDASSGAIYTVDNYVTDPAALGYTPVQQGTGVGQGANTVKLGWSGANLKATVDAIDLGAIAFLGGAVFTGAISAPTVTETSDERKKMNWRPLTDAQLDALANMDLVGIFDWVDGSGTACGGSAQEIRAIVPEAVYEDAFGFLSVSYGGLGFAILQATLRRQRGAK